MNLGIGLGLGFRLGAGVAGPPLAPPINTVAPVISGTATEGQVLTSTQGTWSPAGTTYAYQWKRGATNVGTNANTYTLVTADVGANITCVVTATNTDGSASATSNSLGPVAALPAIPTYAEFVAAETARTSAALGVNASLGASAGSFRTTLSATTDGGFGSPWQRASGYAGLVFTFARHSFPSQAAFDAYLAAGRLVSYTLVSVGVSNVLATTRNGSTTGADTTDAITCADFRYYDDVAGPQKMNPLAGTGPATYTLGT